MTLMTAEVFPLPSLLRIKSDNSPISHPTYPFIFLTKTNLSEKETGFPLL